MCEPIKNNTIKNNTIVNFNKSSATRKAVDFIKTDAAFDRIKTALVNGSDAAKMFAISRLIAQPIVAYGNGLIRPCW
jgi:hypothetical protein